MANVVIGISEMAVVKGNASVITYALGSCVGVALYDSARGIAGLAHVMMPSSGEIRDANINPGKFADTAVPELLKKMSLAGANTHVLTAKIAGGAQMFAMTSPTMNIGERNVAAVKEALALKGIRIIASDTGLNYGRTVEFFAENGIYRIKTISKGIKDI